MRKTVVVGGGAAGLFASVAAAEKGNGVVLIEKNEKLGKKIYITGKGRCNLSNYVDIPEFLNNVVSNPKFLFGALNNLSPEDTFAFFENAGLSLKIERGKRVFPASDKASDVTATIERRLKTLGVKIMLNTKVLEISTENGQVTGVKTDCGEISADSVIICTGGLSYPLTGSDGDGYRFAKDLGHKITPLNPSLVGLKLSGDEFIKAQGLSLKNVAIKILADNKVVYKDFGEMLFTHYGVSGPVILSASCVIAKMNKNGMRLLIDFKPSLDVKTVDLKLQKEFTERNLADLSNALRSVLPKSAVDMFIKRAGIDGKTRCCDLKKADREKITSLLKGFEFSIVGTCGYDEAIVTSGGVDVNEINSKTMESKLIKGLFFAGEVLDVDAFTGGFNMQIAFSTGYTAGKNA